MEEEEKYLQLKRKTKKRKGMILMPGFTIRCRPIKFPYVWIWSQFEISRFHRNRSN
jgi:hypothetical protein